MTDQRKPPATRPDRQPSPLGDLSPRAFFRDYWQKEPLLVRNALPGLDRLLDRDGLFRLAACEDAESRLVSHRRGGWRLRYGPFTARQLETLPRSNWSLLVSGVNLLFPPGDRLLDAFRFVPYARLDDLMVSFAPPGGGVGPHFDSYDVFLVQGLGRRRWEISAQEDLTLVEDCPLRILRRFEPQQSWILEPGDLLYLPPRFAHNGTALSDCMTWSIGFRAPDSRELGGRLLDYLHDHLPGGEMYADPDLRPSAHPGEIPARMMRGLKSMLRTVRWDDAAMEDCIGRYLSEPKANVWFDPPARPFSPAVFRRRLRALGARLDARSRLLYRAGTFFLNGERIEVAPPLLHALSELADHRSLAAGDHPEGLCSLLEDWYHAGFLHLAGVRR